MTYYALDNPRPAYDNDYAGNAPMYDGYIEDEFAPKGYTESAEGTDAESGYYNDAYIYTSWRV